MGRALDSPDFDEKAKRTADESTDAHSRSRPLGCFGILPVCEISIASRLGPLFTITAAGRRSGANGNFDLKRGRGTNRSRI